MTSENVLAIKLERIRSVIDTESIARRNPNLSDIARYYRLSKLAYSFGHDSQFIHMGISRDMKFNKDDLLEQVKIVEKYIRISKAKNVLELGSGRGGEHVLSSQQIIGHRV